MHPRTLAMLAAAALSLATAPSLRAAVTVECPFSGSGDSIDRGFYLDDYPASSLGTVTLAHAAGTAGDRTITLTARLDTYDGPFLGIASVTRSISGFMSKTTFDFGNVSVAPGSRIAFQQALIDGAGSVSFDTGAGPCADVTETEGTTPPLSTFRRDSVGLLVTGDPLSLASATTLSCPASPSGTLERLDRGIYVLDYQGVTLDTVTLRHSADTPGTKTITLIARLHGFDGPVIGAVAVTRSIGIALSPTVFDFGDVPVPAGSTITFEQVLDAGTGQVSYDTGFPVCDDVVGTFGHEPPLDFVRRQSAAIRITGRVASDAPVAAVEYFHAGFGHYFVTANPGEIAALDAGAYGGAFVRTGQSFLVRDGPVPGTAEVCRFFTVAFAPKSSHFYTADAAECDAVSDNPSWMFENIAFHVTPPAGGACPAGLVPVYRMYNNGMTGAPNHRFTTSLATYETFTGTMGWIREGVRFCAPAP